MSQAFQPSNTPAPPLSGYVIAFHGQYCIVQTDNNGTHSLIQCVSKGKKNKVAVGDFVFYQHTSKDQGIITGIQERKNLLYRSDQYKQKRFAANLDQLIIVLATEPHCNELLLARALIAAEAHQIKPLIILNKADLTKHLEATRLQLAPYQKMGYPLLELSIKTDPEKAKALLLPYLNNQVTLLLGQSGTGKSTLINLLIPNAQVATQEISRALNSGKHTTTFTRLYPFGENSALIDSPGFQEFGLYHLTEGTLERAFPDFRPFLGQCQFYNCHHLHEPGCAILNAVQQGTIAPARHRLYAQILHELNQSNY